MRIRETYFTKSMALMLLLAISFSSTTSAQSNSDACHIYLVDVKAAQKAYESLDPNANQAAQAKALSSGVKILGEFTTIVGEEELTTKTYPFPNSKLVVTASVYYTDESMPVSSMMLAIVVSDKPFKSALRESNNAVAEVSYDDHPKIARVRKYLDVDGRSYLIGLQCNSKK